MRTAESILRIKRLIWIYFWLLIFEGAIRKWVLPSAANALLLIRDPIVIYICCVAYRAGIFPRNPFLLVGSILAWVSLMAGLYVLPDAPLVAVYGLRANFLHLPMIFLVRNFFNKEDVRQVGYWTLLLAIPLALLMVIQFRAGAGAWVNAGAGEDAMQLGLIDDKVRASATFSFITGPVLFFSFVAAFLIYGHFVGRVYPRWLTYAATLSLGLAVAVAGSRTLAITVCIIFIFALFAGMVLQPRLAFKTIQLVGSLALISLILLQVPIFNEGMGAFSKRVEGANEAEGGTRGVLNSRVLDDFTRPLETLMEAPTWGIGLGMGTVVGAVLSSGSKMPILYRDAERDLARNIFESGPILGLAFIILRWSLAAYIIRASVRCARQGETLPFLMSSVCGSVLLNGNLGQSTVMGFGVFIGGLCLAAAKDDMSQTISAIVPAPQLYSSLHLGREPS